MKRKISILFAAFLLCALAGGCNGEKCVSKAGYDQTHIAQIQRKYGHGADQPQRRL